jgi:hypothetical protein
VDGIKIHKIFFVTILKLIEEMFLLPEVNPCPGL